MDPGRLSLFMYQSLFLSTAISAASVPRHRRRRCRPRCAAATAAARITSHSPLPRILMRHSLKNTAATAAAAAAAHSSSSLTMKT
jgi:hypothetical protein